jgi:rRNA maturation endonuclease Nob1
MIFLIDSSAVLNDFGFEFSQKQPCLTTPLVVDELRDMRSRHLAENALQSGLLLLREPSEKSLESAKELTAKKGFSRLSAPDISLLALALDLQAEKKRFLLVTDDYSIQNFCSLLGMRFEGVIRGKIKAPIAFSLECHGCGQPPQKALKGGKCPVCGTLLKKVRSPENTKKAPQKAKKGLKLTN